MSVIKSKSFLVAATIFLLVSIPVTTYVIIRSEQTARSPKAATLCQTDCVSLEETESKNSIKADINSDGKVDGTDLAILIANYGKKGKNIADLNNDGIIGEDDLVLLQTKWSK